MKDAVKVAIDNRLKTLDHETGIGIFPEISRDIVKGVRFLIISYGGTGADALYSLKQRLQKNVNKDQLSESVRLLCIDTDKDTPIEKTSVKGSDGQQHVEMISKFDTSEFFWLDNLPAKQAVNLNDAGLQPWINPQLPGMINANQQYLDGSGASSTRQIGRLLLFPQTIVNNLETRVSQLVNELTNDNSDSLKVFIISGISGGTGSGIVVDATYLIRYFIEKMPGKLVNRTQFCGFIMLPPTGRSKNPIDISKGNRNGIAALKEIDHFMTIAFREETYSQQFGATNVTTTKNIFETCYLLDGSSGNVVFGDPRAKANEVVGDCILDMITSLPVAANNGQDIQTVDSFMSDAAAYSQAMIRTQKEQVAPREANYVYCTIGHGKALIPIELMKAYVAGNTFNKMYNLFRNCSNVTEEDVDQFLDEILIPIGQFNEQAQVAKINAEVDNVFKYVNKAAKKGGPYYAINLLKDAAIEAGNRIKELESKVIVLKKEDKIHQLNFIRNVLLKKNDETFTVYVEVMEQMKKYFGTEHDILCDSNKFESYLGTSYTFAPINFSSLDEKSQQMRNYLDNMVSNKRLDELTDKLIDLMISKRAEWTDVLVGKTGTQPKFKAEKLIRDFWQENIEKILDATIEDFLIKYYSGKTDAHYETIMTDLGEEETEETQKWLDTAAEEIVDKMLGSAGIANPLAALRDDLLTKDNFNGKNFFLVPKAAPHLQKYIEEKVKLKIKDNNKVFVTASYANDCISCYAQFTGIPGYMFDWTKNAEKDYEQAVSNATVGLHMSETKGGKLWRNYPNLLVESIWPKIENPAYFNGREHDINQEVKGIFDGAVETGLAVKHALTNLSEFGYYHLLSLPEKFRPDSQLFKNVDNEIPGSKVRADAENILASAIESKAEELFKMADWSSLPLIAKEDAANAVKDNCGITFEENSLAYTNTDPACYVDAITKKPEDWEETLGAKLLRVSPELTDVVRGTVLVIEKLYEKISEAQSVKGRAKQFARYLAAEIFDYNEETYEWIYRDEGVERTFLDFDFGNNEQQNAKYYFMFKAYNKIPEKIDSGILEEFKEKTEAATKAELIDKQKKLKEKANEIATKIEKSLTADKSNPNQEEILTTKAFANACANRGYNADEIVEFYKELLQMLKYL